MYAKRESKNEQPWHWRLCEGYSRRPSLFPGAGADSTVYTLKPTL